MSDNKKYADINNLNRFWSNAKEYIDASVSGGCIIPEYNHTGRYDLKQNKFYKLGIKDHLEIYLDYEYSETAPKYSFQFMSGSVPTNIRINGVSDHGSRCWSDPMNEIYCIYNVNVLGNVVSVKKAYYNHYLTLEAIEDTTFTFSQTGTGTIQYSLDGGYTWNVGSEVTVKAGEQVMWKGNLVAPASTGTTGIGRFNSTGKYCASGNIMSLLYEDDFEDKTDLTGYANAFSGMFGNASVSTSTQNLMSVSNLELPATTLVASCYMKMFENCTNIKSSPVLPATNLANYCYSHMFYNCSSLITAPELPATTLADYCYSHMFYNCSKLTTTPELPATTLVDSCYQYMFYGCSKLTTTPELPATNLADYCYYSMFYGCSKLTIAPKLPVTTLAFGCYQHMFNRCSSLTTAPELPATTLADYCYYYMFYGCTSLNSITMLATDISASKCLYNWVSNVASSGTFTKAASMTSLPTGNSGIPSGWTVVNK